MNKFKTAAASVLAAAMILSLTACDEEPAVSGSNSGVSNADAPNADGTSGNNAPVSAVTTATFDTDPDVQEAAKNAADKLDNPDLEVDTRIKWMAWWEIDETAANAELFKEVYGIPTKGIEKSENYDHTGRIFDYMYTDYNSRYDKLATAIQAGDSPDLFPFEIRDYPYGALQGRYQPIDGIVDLTTDKWAPAKDVMDQFELNGKQYCAIYEISFDSLLYYRKSVIEDAGLQDPRELFENDNWTWDTFLEMARAFQKSGDDRYVTEGFNTEIELLVSTGTPIISIENGKLVNNMNSANVQRAMDLLKTLQSENLRWPIQENGWSLNPKLWAQGNILFYADGGTWTFEGDSGLKKFADRFSWNDDEICVVPYPRDPQADKYYHFMKQDALMWCKGSTNANGVAAWIDCCVTTSLDPEVTATSRKQAKDKYGWTDYNLDFIYSQTTLDGTSKITPIFDFKNGIGNDIADAGKSESPVEALTKTVYLSGDKTYAQLNAEYFTQIDTRINEINEKISKL